MAVVRCAEQQNPSDMHAADGLGRDPKVLPLTEAHREELDRRLDDLEAEGPVGIPWDELVDQIRARSRAI